MAGFAAVQCVMASPMLGLAVAAKYAKHTGFGAYVVCGTWLAFITIHSALPDELWYRLKWPCSSMCSMGHLQQANHCLSMLLLP
jgi:hypothetical protein